MLWQTLANISILITIISPIISLFFMIKKLMILIRFIMKYEKIT
jgi:hypothetical protein